MSVFVCDCVCVCVCVCVRVCVSVCVSLINKRTYLPISISIIIGICY